MNQDTAGKNSDRIQRNMNLTIENMLRANEIIVNTPDKKLKQALTVKNQRREQALENMRPFS